MMNCNWMAKLAAHNQTALINYGYSANEVKAMSAREVELQLQKLGYDFKSNSPFKNKNGTNLP